MAQFLYRGRDKEGRLRTGQRTAATIDNLNSDLINEGISPIQITPIESHTSFWQKLQRWTQSENLHLEELAIFSRQMQQLHHAGVPMTTALKQLSNNTRSQRLAQALRGVIENLEKGQGLATAMQHYPNVFSPLMINLIQIGENTGHLSESFAHLHHYLEFELNNRKQIKAAFRYPIFVLTSIIFAILVLNLFVIPTFARFYTRLEVTLPWQTRILIGLSNFFVDDGIYLLIGIIILSIFIFRYLRTPQGKYRWHKLELKIPFMGKLLKRLILIRFTESLSMMLNAGLSVTQALALAKNIIFNTYILEQISDIQETIERGVSFTNAIAKSDLFTPLEMQILAVGEKNGELSPALKYISEFHSHEIEYDLKRFNDVIGPILISAVSGLILIIALGVYLPVWNMINLIHS